MLYKFLISSLICFLFAAFSIADMFAELLPFYRNSGSIKAGAVTVFDTFKLEHGYSSYSKFLILNDCLIGMQILTSDSKSIVKKHDFDVSCSKISMHIVESMPSYSFAWYVNALANIITEDVNSANASLYKSYITAPNEGWLAGLRIVFYEKNKTLLNLQSRDIYLSDLMLLGYGTEGLDYIVRRYRSEPAMQPTIVRLLKKLPADRQKKFLVLMRKPVVE